MIIAQLSDTHLLAPTDQDPLSSLRETNLRRCVEAINGLERQPDAVIHTGDMINFDSQNDYRLAGEILGRLKAPLYPTVGNRDSRPDFIRALLAPRGLADETSFCQYRVRLRQLDLVSVDTKSDTRRIGTSCERRLRQLEALLEQDTEKPVCLFLHHPPTEVYTLKNPLQFESKQHAEAFTQLFDRYDNILHIFCGHTHMCDMFRIGRHQASTLPSIATDVRDGRYSRHLDDVPLFQLHELHEDGQLATTTMLVGEDIFTTRQIEQAAE